MFKKKVSDFVYLINSAKYKDRVKLFRMISKGNKISVLIELSDYSESVVLKQLKNYEIIELIESAVSDDAVEILEHLNKKRANLLLKQLPAKTKNRLIKLLKYAQDTAGGLMQSEMIVVDENDTVANALNKIKNHRIKIKFNNLYVVDKKGIFKGLVPLKVLIQSKSTHRMKSIMLKNIVVVQPHVDQERVARIFRTHKLYSIPVVDKKGYLLGRITYDDIIDTVEEEIQEDMYRTVGLEGDEDVFDPIKKAFKSRSEWLIINLFTAFIAVATISLFENTLKNVILLAVFLPVVAGMGGNAGTQTLTIVIRGIAIGRLKLKDYTRVLGKEIGLGIINGIITGIVGGAVAILIGANWLIGVVIFLAMIINLVNAGIMGVLIPLLLKKVGQDPALGSGIILTTFTDVIGFFSYLGIATIMIALFGIN